MSRQVARRRTARRAPRAVESTLRQQLAVKRGVGSVIDKLMNYVRTVLWTLRMAQKPDPKEFKITAKLLIGLTFTVGFYAFLVSLIRLLVFAGRPGATPLARIPPPASYIVAGIVAATVIGIGVYLYISFRKTVKETTRRRV